MLVVIFFCGALIALTTVIHYEVLRGLSKVLPALAIPHRSKLLVVIFAAFFAHALEIGAYGVTLFLLVKHTAVGGFNGMAELSLVSCLYFSAETYTSLGFGDVTPVGPVRLLAGVEALNGLLLIGWSASYIYISMERFWKTHRTGNRS